MPKVKGIIQRSLFVDECVVHGKTVKEGYSKSRMNKMAKSMFRKIGKSAVLEKHCEKLKQKLSMPGMTFEQFVNTAERAFDRYIMDRSTQHALKEGLYANSERVRTDKEIVESEQYQKMVDNPIFATKVVNDHKKKLKTACKALSENKIVQEALGEHGKKIFGKQIKNFDQVPLMGFVGEIEKALQARIQQKAA